MSGRRRLAHVVAGKPAEVVAEWGRLAEAEIGEAARVAEVDRGRPAEASAERGWGDGVSTCPPARDGRTAS